MSAASHSRDEDELDRSIPNLVGWRQSFDVSRKDWLMLGKGPSYAELLPPHLDEYYTCSLNHVVREHPVDVAHAIDIDVVRDCGDAILKHARFLILPYYLHERFVASEKPIHQFVSEIPALQALKNEGRLVWYNLSSSNRRIGSSPVIEVVHFGAEAALDVLATCGARRIRSLGVDGGNRYASSFGDLESRTLLKNSHDSYDVQFRQMARTIRRKGIFYAPLNKEAPIRVFVGTDLTQTLAARVLEYSIKKYASMSVDVTFLTDVPVRQPKDEENRARTESAFARFVVPSLCGYRGRAIYLDADMLVFDDIAKLWDKPMKSVDFLCAEQPLDKGRQRQYGALLMDCARLRWNVDDIINGLDEHRYSYAQLMHDFCLVPPERVAADVEYPLIHHSDMDSSWYDVLREAVAEGFISHDEARLEQP